MAVNFQDAGSKPPPVTTDRLCDALRYFLNQIAENPEQPVDQNKGIVLYVVPGDRTMQAVLDAFSGELKITVRELPTDLSPAFGPLIGSDNKANLWEPSKEADCQETPICSTYCASEIAVRPGYCTQEELEVTAVNIEGHG